MEDRALFVVVLLLMRLLAGGASPYEDIRLQICEFGVSFDDVGEVCSLNVAELFAVKRVLEPLAIAVPLILGLLVVAVLSWQQ